MADRPMESVANGSAPASRIRAKWREPNSAARISAVVPSGLYASVREPAKYHCHAPDWIPTRISSHRTIKITICCILHILLDMVIKIVNE